MEFGGYLEMESFSLPMLHDKAIALNCGRNCMAYLIETKNIKRIAIPTFLCKSVYDVCARYGVEIFQYAVGKDLKPCNLELEPDVWLYLVNYYGQIDNEYIGSLKEVHSNLLVDNVQAYFQEPITGVDTLYTCRKFFGVPDGAFLYTDVYLKRDLEVEKSGEYMKHLLGRYEGCASDYYSEYHTAENRFENSPIKRMSRITWNFLHAINYNEVRERRKRNYEIIRNQFDGINQLQLMTPEGPFMYPLLVHNGEKMRKKLLEYKVYIPVLWPDVLQYDSLDSDLDWMVRNLLPLPVDQRYQDKQLHNLCEIVKRVLDT